MMCRRSLSLLGASVALGLGSPAAGAFECPQHFETARAAIEKVEQDMQGMEQMMAKEDMMLVHALLDDAKMLLEGAKRDHDRPRGPYDHARAIAKADAAQGHATAADILHFQMMQMQ